MFSLDRGVQDVLIHCVAVLQAEKLSRHALEMWLALLLALKSLWNKYQSQDRPATESTIHNMQESSSNRAFLRNAL